MGQHVEETVLRSPCAHDTTRHDTMGRAEGAQSSNETGLHFVLKALGPMLTVQEMQVG